MPLIRSATNGDPPGQRDERVVAFDCDPGDVIVFSAAVLHGAPAVASPERGRRAVALRYLGGDVVVDESRYGQLTSMAPFARRFLVISSTPTTNEKRSTKISATSYNFLS